MPPLPRHITTERRITPAGQTVWVAWANALGHQFRSAKSLADGHATESEAVIEVQQRLAWAEAVIAQVAIGGVAHAIKSIVDAHGSSFGSDPMPIRTLRKDPILRARRAAIRAYWTAHPATPARDVAAVFGVSESTALDHKPYHLRTIRPPARQWKRMEADSLALRLYEADWPLGEIAEATGRSITTTRRYLRAVTRGQP
jgi:hypothetical protein